MVLVQNNDQTNCLILLGNTDQIFFLSDKNQVEIN